MKKEFTQQEDKNLIRIFINDLKRSKEIDSKFLKYLEKDWGSTNLEIYFRKLYKIWWNIWFSPNDKDVKMKADRIRLIREIRDKEFPKDASHYKSAPEYWITEIKERKRVKIKSKKDLKLEREYQEIIRLRKQYKITNDSAYLNKIGECIRKIANTKEFEIGEATSDLQSEKEYTSKLKEHPFGIINASKDLIEFMDKNGEISPEELKSFLKKKAPVIVIQRIMYLGEELHTKFNQVIRGEQKKGTMTLEKYEVKLGEFNFKLSLY